MRREPPARNRHVQATVRRVVEARDGHRCRVPGCTCMGPHELSHLEAYADGTPATPETLAQHFPVADGTFLGTGEDPRPASPGLSHVGNEPRSQDMSRKPPGPGRKRSA